MPPSHCQLLCPLYSQPRFSKYVSILASSVTSPSALTSVQFGFSPMITPKQVFPGPQWPCPATSDRLFGLHLDFSAAVGTVDHAHLGTVTTLWSLLRILLLWQPVQCCSMLGVVQGMAQPSSPQNPQPLSSICCSDLLLNFLQPLAFLTSLLGCLKRTSAPVSLKLVSWSFSQPWFASDLPVCTFHPVVQGGNAGITLFPASSSAPLSHVPPHLSYLKCVSPLYLLPPSSLSALHSAK